MTWKTSKLPFISGQRKGNVKAGAGSKCKLHSLRQAIGDRPMLEEVRLTGRLSLSALIELQSFKRHTQQKGENLPAKLLSCLGLCLGPAWASVQRAQALKAQGERRTQVEGSRHLPKDPNPCPRASAPTQKVQGLGPSTKGPGHLPMGPVPILVGRGSKGLGSCPAARAPAKRPWPLLKQPKGLGTCLRALAPAQGGKWSRPLGRGPRSLSGNLGFLCRDPRP